MVAWVSHALVTLIYQGFERMLIFLNVSIGRHTLGFLPHIWSNVGVVFYDMQVLLHSLRNCIHTILVGGTPVKADK